MDSPKSIRTQGLSVAVYDCRVSLSLVALGSLKGLFPRIFRTLDINSLGRLFFILLVERFVNSYEVMVVYVGMAF